MSKFLNLISAMAMFSVFVLLKAAPAHALPPMGGVLHQESVTGDEDVNEDGSQLMEDVELVGGKKRGRKKLTGRAAQNFCPQVEKVTVELLGAKKAKCYMSLFKHEVRNCDWQLMQKKGNAGNPNVGYGICTLEANPQVRNSRGHAACKSINTIAQQVQCCRAIMLSGLPYWGPINRGKTRRCN